MKTPRENVGGEANCYDALADLDIAIRESMLPEHGYYVLGGIASGAILHESTVLDKQSNIVVARSDSAISTVRANGTRRDVDILIDTVLSKEDSEQIKAAVTEAVGSALVVSVFGFDTHQERISLFQREMRSLSSWVSSRTVDEQGMRRYELFPVSRPVDLGSYEPWKLLLPNGSTVDVLNPAGHYLAYGMRSISGVRAKDQAKYNAMRKQVEPLFTEEIMDGPFKEWRLFARDIQLLGLGCYLSDGEFHPDSGADEKQLFKLKSKLLRWAEAHEGIVNIAQQDLAQRALNVFVHAK